ncbi:MAG: hypothetical protein JWO46_2018 [Nocardioidaceae bacterium]|nr:hypothetical protein [Nocardioidaceae bacterium]
MPDERVSYGAWGEQFFASAISEERILGAVDVLAGQPIDVGPIGAGPRKMVKLRAYGAIGAASATRIGDGDPAAPIGFRVLLPVHLSFDVDLQVEVHKFHADLVVPLTLTATALDGVRIFVDVEPPSADEVQVAVRAEGLRASIVKRVANIEGELRRFVARYVSRELAKPHVQDARLIDVGAMIDKAWDSLRPAPAPPSGVVADLTDAVTTEIREREGSFLAPER